MSRRIVSIYNRVKELLEKDSRYRDSDEMLVARVWHIEMKEKCGHDYMNTMKAYDFFCSYSRDEITNSDSITRARRKVQQEHPELRGKNWERKQEVETKNTITELRELK